MLSKKEMNEGVSGVHPDHRDGCQLYVRTRYLSKLKYLPEVIEIEGLESKRIPGSVLQ